MALNFITPAVREYIAPHPKLEEFVPDRDRALFADPEKAALLAKATAVEEITPYIGTELKGVQLSKLTDAQKDELALLVAERGVVFLRDQDITLEQQHELASYYGKQDRDPNQQDPRHVTIIGRDGNIRQHNHFGAEYHADHSFEVNPPSYTLLRMVKTPPSGGDTIFTSQTALFDKLSAPFQNALEGLHAVHSADRSYLSSINGGGAPLRAPIATAHPLIRNHPVTALKILNYNPTFIDRILELHGQESAHILAFLREHLLQADDLTVRWKWTSGAVAFWDNRSVVHKALPGGYDVTMREGKRTAVHGERPFFDPERSESLSQKRKREERETGVKRKEKHMTNFTLLATLGASLVTVNPYKADHIGATEWVINGRCTGKPELELTQNGTKQVRVGAEMLVGPGKLVDPFKMAPIFCSPHQRAVVTMDLSLGDEQKAALEKAGNIALTEPIAEWDCGDYEGVEPHEITELRKQQALEKCKIWWMDVQTESELDLD